MLLPSVEEAGTWFVAAARAALDRGERLDARAVSLFLALSPGGADADRAIAQLDDEPPAASVVFALARHASEVLHGHIGAAHESAARDAVTALEEEVLRRYRPGEGVGSLQDDAAVASAMLRASQVGHDPAHRMMAEELALTALRRHDVTAGLSAFTAGAELAVVLWHLAEPAGNPSYRDRAREVLLALTATYQQHGWRAAPFISALHAIR